MADEDLLEEIRWEQTIGVCCFTCHVSAGEDLSSGKSAAPEDQGCSRHDASVSTLSGHCGWMGDGLQMLSLAFFREEHRGSGSAIDEATKRLLKVIT
ncbi:MAG TPA: hypothetical protein VI386_09950, partial [Candidatus Sulfotelmatobacter sp.]